MKRAPRLRNTRKCGFLAAIAAILLLPGCGSTNTPATVVQPQGKLYVAVPFSPSSSNGAILRFDNPSMLNGNATPGATIAGPQTQFGILFGSMVLDKTNDRLYALVSTTSITGSILVFDHISTKNGNVAPDRVIAGPATQMLGTGALVVDTSKDVAYTEAGFDASGHVTIMVFRNVSTLNGNVAPSAVLQLDPPGAAAFDLALDETGNRLFALMNNASISVFDNVSTLTSGLMVPNRIIAGANTGLTAPNHMALDAAGRLLVSNNAVTPTLASIVIFANAATANGNVTPVATITGNSTGLNVVGPEAMTVVTGPGSSPSGDLYVNVDLGNVLVFKNIGTANGNVSPDHLFFVATNGSANLGLSFDNSR
ncbi:MAG TPA: hypothetical protein VHW72_16305 [Candidatus Angelobacter sp.]|nr:hypothetical protein [Candidatus Angelobacter sp.]